MRLDVKKNAKNHGCLGISDGSWLEPDKDTEIDDAKLDSEFDDDGV